jgi:predicted O-methyltransferase YrrM
MPNSLINPFALEELVREVRSAPPGDIVEVGVYQGGSAARLAEVAREQGRRLFLFDTFTGIPYAGEFDFHKVGDFSDTSEVAVRAAIPDAEIVPGLFPDTLHEGVGPIALAHIDCDQYESVRACCKALEPRMIAGGVMVFDDYDVLNGARLAVEECFPGRVQFSEQGKARVRF